MEISKKALAAFWASEFINEEGLCFFCKNKGKVTMRYHDTRFCICPNGRALKKAKNE